MGYKDRQYAVVIDAGSTGSRVLAYEFHKSYLDGRLVLDREIFREVKPGLSSFVDNPTDGAKKIALLLDEAKVFIPEHLWSNTPLVLKATAGTIYFGRTGLCCRDSKFNFNFLFP